MSSWRTPREPQPVTGWFGGELLTVGDEDYDSNKTWLDPDARTSSFNPEDS